MEDYILSLLFPNRRIIRMHLHWTNIILTALSVAIVLVGTLLIVKSTKENNSLYSLYGLFSLVIAVYIGLILISNHYSSNPFFQRLSWTSGIFSSIIFLYFSYKLTHYRISRLTVLFTLLPMTVFIFLILLTDIIVSPNASILFLNPNIVSLGLILFFSICWIKTFSNLVISYKRSVGKIRFVVLLSIISSLVALLLAISFELIFPNYFNEITTFISAAFTGTLVLVSGFLYLIA